MLGTSVLSLLEDIGCCQRCILIFLGERSDLLYTSAAGLTEAISDAVKQVSESDSEVKNSSGVTAKCEDSLKDEGNDECSSDGVEITLKNGTDEHIVKKQKCTVCITCIGMFQWGCSADAVTMLSDAMLDAGHDADSFSLALSIPASLNLRVHRIWTLLLQAFPQFPAKGREDHVGTIKDAWKNVVGPRVAATVGKSFVHGVYHDFVFNISCSYLFDLEDCKIMDKLCGSLFAVRQKQHKKYANSVYSKQAIETAMKKLSDKEFLTAYPDPPSIPEESVTFSSLQCQQAPLYMAGRYNKYSRDLPQTPWFVEGERKLGSSVQELLCDTLNKTVQAEDLKFSSSGREDVDVRCLGNGRPFVVEFINPRCTKLKKSQVTTLQKTINSSTTLVRLRDLQIVDKKEIKNLKEGEEEKTKAYCALCLASQGYDQASMEKISALSEVRVEQKTPLRVLHRRPLATRPRLIHTIRATPLDSHYFKLHLTTQAGTYIKEFIHGDLGRTVPNLREIIGSELDIVALDVENVALDWPPKCSE